MFDKLSEMLNTYAMTVAAAAKELGTTEHYVRHMCDEGKLNAIQYAHVWIIDAADVKAKAAKTAARAGLRAQRKALDEEYAAKRAALKG
jgi:hypothetical protein